MTDTKLLREQVDKSGLKYQFIAENLDFMVMFMVIFYYEKTYKHQQKRFHNY